MRGLYVKCRHIYIDRKNIVPVTLEGLETRHNDEPLTWNLDIHRQKIFCAKITSSTRLGSENYEIISTYHSGGRNKSSYIPPTLIKINGTYQPKGKKVNIYYI